MHRIKNGLMMALLAALTATGCTNDAPPPTDGGMPAAPSTSAPAAPDAQALFQANCASCHRLDRDATGPMIGGALARWGGDRARLKAFIHNSSKVIADGDPYAVALYNKWNKAGMYAFPQLTDAELDALLTLME